MHVDFLCQTPTTFERISEGSLEWNIHSHTHLTSSTLVPLWEDYLVFSPPFDGGAEHDDIKGTRTKSSCRLEVKGEAMTTRD